jgi:hypothetical protein
VEITLNDPNVPFVASVDDGNLIIIYSTSRWNRTLCAYCRSMLSFEGANVTWQAIRRKGQADEKGIPLNVTSFPLGETMRWELLSDSFHLVGIDRNLGQEMGSFVDMPLCLRLVGCTGRGI